MRRPARKFLSQVIKIDSIPAFELALPYLVLLDMMELAKADRPAIRWFKRASAICVTPHVSALNRSPQAAFDAAMVAADPGTMRRAFALVRRSRRAAFKPFRNSRPGHSVVDPPELSSELA